MQQNLGKSQELNNNRIFVSTSDHARRQFGRGPLILRIHSEKRRKGQEDRSISGLPLSSGAQTNRRSKIEFIFWTLPNQVPIPGNRCGKAKSTCNLVAGLAMWSGPIEFQSCSLFQCSLFQFQSSSHCPIKCHFLEIGVERRKAHAI